MLVAVVFEVDGKGREDVEGLLANIAEGEGKTCHCDVMAGINNGDMSVGCLLGEEGELPFKHADPPSVFLCRFNASNLLKERLQIGQ